jgi:hypothetical protein
VSEQQISLSADVKTVDATAAGGGKHGAAVEHIKTRVSNSDNY